MDKTETLLSKDIETSVGNCKETGNTILRVVVVTTLLGGKMGLGWPIRRDFWDDLQLLFLNPGSGYENVCSLNYNLFCGNFCVLS